MKLHIFRGGPPSSAIRQALKFLNLKYELIDVNYEKGEHKSEEYEKMNPQKEIPILEDDGFYLSESAAILQYICDKYKPNSNMYPKDPNIRAVVNHRLCFYLSTYYRNITEYTMDPKFLGIEKTPERLSKMMNTLQVFDTYLKRLDKKYAAADNLTIADCLLISGIICMKVVDFDFSQFEYISKWVNVYKSENPELWNIAEEDINVLKQYF